MVYATNGAYAVTGENGYIEDEILNSEDMKKLFVAKIPIDSKDEDLKSFFENICGGVITEHIVVRKENAKSHFGFFTFESSHLVDEVIFREKELVFNNTTLEVNRAVPKKDYLTGAHHKTKKLFITSIPKTGVSEEDLKRYFEERHHPKYGTIESIQFIKKKDEAGNKLEENKGFGFITVSSEHMADTMAIQHTTFDFGGQRIELKKSDQEGHQIGRGGPRGGRGGPRGGRGGQRGGRGGRGGSQVDSGSYGGGYGYGGYGDGYGQWDYYSAYGMYPQYGVSSAVRGGRGGTSSRGGRGGRGGGRGSRGGKRYTPYAKKP